MQNSTNGISNISWTQFQNWFSLNKSIDADLVSELKNLDSYKFTEYIQINKDLDSFDLYLQEKFTEVRMKQSD